MVKILVFGGAHIDRRGHISVGFTAGASHPGVWHEEAGGGAFNAARNLSCLGHHVTLIAPRGGDAAGELVSEAALRAGITDRPFTFLDRATPSYTAIIEQNGNLVAGLADMDLYHIFTPRRLRVRSVREAISATHAILMDANLPAETLTAIGRKAKEEGKFLAAMGISPAKVLRLKHALPFIDMLFVNQREALALTGKDDITDAIVHLKSLDLRGFIITNGREPIHAFHNGSDTLVQPPDEATIVDVTGAGDALAGAVLSALLKGTELAIALRDGVAAAVITLGSPHAVAPEFSEARLSEVVRSLAQPKLTLRH